MKQWTLRLPEEVLDWLREKAAKEMLKRKKQVSMNSIALEVLTKAMKTDREKGGLM